MRALVALVAAFAASSCFSLTMDWERVESCAYIDPDGVFRLDVPAGWARSGNSLTRDGQALQRIVWNSRLLGDDEKRLWTDPSPTAERAKVLGPLSFPDTQCLGSAHATVSGRPGIRVHQARENAMPFILASLLFGLDPHRVRVERVEYGVVAGDRLFTFYYEAPALHYFARDLPVFERLVASFELLEPGEGAVGAQR